MYWSCRRDSLRVCLLRYVFVKALNFFSPLRVVAEFFLQKTNRCICILKRIWYLVLVLVHVEVESPTTDRGLDSSSLRKNLLICALVLQSWDNWSLWSFACIVGNFFVLRSSMMVVPVLVPLDNNVVKWKFNKINSFENNAHVQHQEPVGQ
jgi:hypothetical protein